MSDTQHNVLPSNVWLLPAATLFLCACYAEIPGSAPVDDSSSSLFPDSGTLGGIGGTLSGGGLGGDPDGGPLDPADAGGNLDATIVSSCDGIAIGTVQTRKLYAEAQVVPPATCKSETQMRTCRNTGWSGWSGTFKAESCTQAAVHSCGDVAHGATESRERYPSATVNDLELCEPEEQTRECDDGTLGPWSGTATATTCEVSFLGHCNILSEIKCVATTSCSFKVTGSQCLGASGHACAANAECASAVCVNGSCTAKVPVAGACDETADCAACSGSIAATCTASNVCACGVGATCTNNNQCQGTCVASRCVAPNTTCDMDDDCAANSKCVKMSSGPGSGNTGTCLLKDGQSCTSNAQCQNVCRPSENNELFAANQKVCAAKGSGMSGMEAHCDENADCMGSSVCRPWSGQTVTGGTHCQSVGTAGEFCDETIDCAQNTPATCNTTSSTCVLTLVPSGSPCLVGLQCSSGICDTSMGTPGSCQ